MKKLFICANELLSKSYQLAGMIWEDGYRPTHLIGIWRGGTPIAIAVHEFYDAMGAPCLHMPIKTRRKKIGEANYHISIMGLPFLLETIEKDSRLLLVDDIFDTGLTMSSLCSKILEHHLQPEIRTATIFYKPSQNLTDIKPNYYIVETNAWIVFPHEIKELNKEELKQQKKFLWEQIEAHQPWKNEEQQ